MMFNSTGERVCYCRNLLRLTQSEFAASLNLSKPTIARWELNTVEIPHKKLETIMEFCIQNNLLVSKEWLLLGIGAEPRFSEYDKPVLNFDEITYKTYNSLKFDDDNLKLYQVTSNFMSPILQYADYIIVKNEYNKLILHNKVCCIEKEKEIIVGIYNSLDHRITNYSGQFIIIDKNCTISEVKWIIKR